MKEVLLGFEVGDGSPVRLRPSHLIVTGITQLSGKTTTLEALINRSDFRAIAFRTKPGEAGFSAGKVIPPFFVERSDWQYIESLLEATLKERLKFERSWIIRACKGAGSIEEVDKNISELLGKSREGSLQHGVYTSLHAYFELVLPQLKHEYFSSELTLHDGVNIMDLEKFSDEVQSLVIRSVLEHVLRNERNTVVIVPEAWKFLPEKRGSPVKYAAEAFIRQGATRGNFLWIDSQDLAGVDKSPLKQVSNWILGLQLERNEVQHTLDQIPLPSSLKPRPEKVMTLKVGHFICCNPTFTKEAYVMPAWLNEEIAKKVSLGELGVEQVMDRKRVKIEEISFTQDALISSLREELKKSAKRISGLERENTKLIEKRKSLEFEMDRLRKRKAVPIEKFEQLKGVQLQLKGVVKKYNLLVKKAQQMAQALSKFEEVAEAPEVRLVPPALEAPPATPLVQQTPVPAGTPQTLSIPLEKNLLLQKLGGMPKKIYETLLQHSQGLTKPQIGILTGYSYTGGSFSNSMSKLNTMKLIKKEGEIYRVV